MSELRTVGCKVEAKISSYRQQLDPRKDDGYYLGTTSSKAVIRYWNQNDPNKINSYVTANLFEYTAKLPNGDFSPGYQLTHGIPKLNILLSTSINIIYHPFIEYPPYVFHIILLLKGRSLGLTLKEYTYNSFPYIV